MGIPQALTPFPTFSDPEGYGRYHHLDNAKFISNTRASCWEVLDHLITAHDEKIITTETLEQGRILITQSVKLLNGYLRYLRKAATNNQQQTTNPQMIPYGRQDITDADIAAVEAVLRSDFLTQGPAVPRFEQAVADNVGAAHGVAVNSATSALHIACLALDLGPGDWLWTSPNSFVASANCARYCGAKVDFVDIDPRTYNLSVEAPAAKLEQAEREGRPGSRSIRTT